ncbi:homoserine dehydrogenase [archaeon SCG-AAA382B04]|nr:homoserine dehydrogenase [archaeon SCG-AAA382B04]
MKIALLGFGTVGQKVAKILESRKNFYENKYGFSPEIVLVEDSNSQGYHTNGLNPKKLLERKEEKGDVGSGRKLDLNDVEFDVLVECTPTNLEDGEPGLSNILQSLELGRDVVTSNKGPLAIAWEELKQTSSKNDSILRYEATVGGAMPTINLAKDSLAGNKIKQIRGILNGTCNYILSRMRGGGLPYDHVLSEAQDLGIAEADPSYDVEGIDTALKIVILANSLLDFNVKYSDVDVTGITGITSEALDLANEENRVIKLIGKVNGDKLEVGPKMIPKNHPLAVKGTLNVASLKTDLAGEITITGKGAGASETASSIISDLISINRVRNFR